MTLILQKRNNQEAERYRRRNDLPNASATPLTIPETTVMATKPSAPPPPRPVGLLFCKTCRTPSSQDHVRLLPPARIGATKPQNAVAIKAPVTLAAMKPASDLRGASGRRRTGRRAGSLGVKAP